MIKIFCLCIVGDKNVCNKVKSIALIKFLLWCAVFAGLHFHMLTKTFKNCIDIGVLAESLQTIHVQERISIILAS